MRIALVSQGDDNGGAARAALRLHLALRTIGVDSRFHVAEKRSQAPAVIGPSSVMGRIASRIRPAAAGLVCHMQTTSDRAWRSPAIFPSGFPQRIACGGHDITHLHWIGGETMSIGEIGRLRGPLIWTLHDMWPFCGAEHYAPDDGMARWRTGYPADSKSSETRGFDLDAWVWRRKLRAYRRMQLITPSRWLADCARASLLMGGWPVAVIPNALDTEVFRPLARDEARRLLDLPSGVPLVLFGSYASASDPRKGFDLMLEAIGRLASRVPGLAGIVMGESDPLLQKNIGIPLHRLGLMTDDRRIAAAYAAADVTVVPSRQDNLPQSATEAQSCGCPVVAFNVAGLSDAVVHGVTGWLSPPFDVADLVEGIIHILADPGRRDMLGAAARARAVSRWAPEVVARSHADLYRQVLEMDRAGRGS